MVVYYVSRFIVFSVVIVLGTGVLVAQEKKQPGDEPTLVSGDIDNLVLRQWRNEDQSKTDDLCLGDKLLEWDGQPLTDNDDLVKRWLDKRAGQTTQVIVERMETVDGKSEPRRLEIKLLHESPSDLYKDALFGGRTEFRTAEQIHPDWEKIDPPLKQVALQALADKGPQVLQALDGAFQRQLQMLRDHYRSDHIAYLLTRPFHCEMWARQYMDGAAAATTPQQLFAAAWLLADPQSRALPEIAPAKPIAADATFAECVAALEEQVAGVDKAYADLFSEFTVAEKAQLQKWMESFQPVWRGQEGWQDFVDGMKLTKRIPSEKLGRAMALSGLLMNEIVPGGAIFERLKATAAAAQAGKPSTHTTVLGPEADQATIKTQITIDLGGDDAIVFADHSFPNIATIYIDLGGDDTLLDRGGGLAAGIGRTSLIVNAGGNDVYLGGARSVGFGVLGAGVLWDVDGHDTYRGSIFTQGVGCLGLGIVLDQAGNDRYEGSSYSQAVGLTAGCGLLLDRDGDDVYVCTGKDESPYGEAGEYAGWCQGCGFGFRGAGAGGVGALLDLAGRDFYRAGQFGLGCGYYFGVGVVYDRTGDDVYECSHYGLATGAHYAAGLVLDDAGRDTYLSIRPAGVASLGGTWDLCLGALIDGSGDDVYQGEVYTLGAAAQTAYGFLWDKQGRDFYRTSGGSEGEGAGFIGGATYGGGRLARNLAIFLDEGSAEDDYRIPERTNNNSGVHSEFGIWIDR